MKRLILVGFICAAVLAGARADEEKFTSSVSPEDLAAAGLAGLTPAQSARLNALVEAYKSGALAAARRAANEALAAKQAAEAQAARAEAKADAARAEALKADAARAQAAQAESARPAPAAGFLTKAKDLFKPGPAAEAAVVESSIPGKFRGWDPHQVFTLANGQRYQVADNVSYYSPAVENPRVQVLPATLAGYWLRFPDTGAQVRVNLIGDK